MFEKLTENEILGHKKRQNGNKRSREMDREKRKSEWNTYIVDREIDRVIEVREILCLIYHNLITSLWIEDDDLQHIKDDIIHKSRDHQIISIL